MPFTLREENSTENPALAVPYGKQITAGRLAYYVKEGGRTRCILFLGEGEQDGVDRVYYNGEILPEYDSTGGRIWRYHNGTKTSNPTFVDVTSISGTNITLASNPFNTSTEKEVSIIYGVDTVPTSLPSGVKQHQKLYVVYSSGNTIRLSLTDGGSAISWSSSTHLLTNMRVYRANKGFFDAIQGRPEFFPTIDFTFSEIAYLEVNLPTIQSEVEDEPSRFKIFVRGKRLQNYTSTGLLADAYGVAYPDQDNLPAQSKFFSANNALIAVDIMLNQMKIAPSRIDWASFVKFRDYCDQSITWNSGSTPQLGWANFFGLAKTVFTTVTNVTESPVSFFYKTSASTGWNSGGISTESISGTETVVQASGTLIKGHLAVGMTKETSASGNPDNFLYSIRADAVTGNVSCYRYSSQLFSLSGVVQENDEFKIATDASTVSFYRNNSVIFSTSKDMDNGNGNPVKCGFALYSSDAKVGNLYVHYNGLNNITEFPQGTFVKTSLTNGLDSGGISTQTFADSETKIDVTSVWQAGTYTFGMGKLTSVSSAYTISNYLYSITINASTKSFVCKRKGSTLFTSANDEVFAGDVFRVGISGTIVSFYRNGTEVFSTTSNMDTGDTNPLRVAFVLDSSDAKLGDLQLYPLKGQSRLSNRFDAHVVFPSQIASNIALEQVMGRAPGCHWQDVNGKITFLVKPSYKNVLNGESYTSGDRVLCHLFSFDPEAKTKSNIVFGSFDSFKKKPDEKQNYMRVEYRDLSDEFYTKKYTTADRQALRDYVETLVDFGIVQIGTANQSLSDRMGESTLRWNTDLDLFVTCKGMFDSFKVAKGDIVKFAHEVPNWTNSTAPEFIVIDETFDFGTADERTFTLQIYNDTFYSDTEHGEIVGNLPVGVSALTPPPAASSISLYEDVRSLPDGTSYNVITGSVTFASFPYRQRARIYWKKSNITPYEDTGIVLEQPDTSITSMSFELNFAPIGVNSIKVVTENTSGVISTDTPTQNSLTIVGGAILETVVWDKLVNTQMVGGKLKKIAGGSGWNAGAISTRAIASGTGKLSFLYQEERSTVGFGCYNYTDAGQNMVYGIQLQRNVVPSIVINGSTYSANANAVVAVTGQGFEIVLESSNVKFYQITDDERLEIYSTATYGKFPLHVDVSIYSNNHTVGDIFLYGKLEDTTGQQVHWQSLRGVEIDVASGIETVRKVLPTGWYQPNIACTFGYEGITGDGALEFEVTETNTYRMVGLSTVDYEETDPTAAPFLHVNYALYLRDDGYCEIQENNNSPTGPFAYSTGDILRIRRVGSQVTYWKNGAQQHVSTVGSSGTLFADTALYANNATIKDVRIKPVNVSNSTRYPFPAYYLDDMYVSANRPQEDGTVYFELAGTFLPNTSDPVLRAKVRVYNKFGQLVNEFPSFTYSGNGIIAQGYHDRKYADPYEEAIYEVILDNGNGLSPSIYLKGSFSVPPTFTTSYTMPTLIAPDTCVQNLVVTPVSHEKVTLSWFWNGAIDVYKRIPESGLSWVSFVPDPGASPASPPDALVPNTVYEFKACENGYTERWSNIVRVRMPSSPPPAATYPAPLSLVGSPDTVTPTTVVNLSWQRNSTTNTGAQVYKNGVLYYDGSTAGETTKAVTGLTADTTYLFTVRNKYSGPNYSAFSNEISVTTGSGASNLSPIALYTVVTSPYSIDLRWTNRTSSNTVDIEISDDYGSSWTVIDNVAATVSYVVATGLIPNTTYYFRVKNTGVAGYSNEAIGTTFDWQQY